MKAYTTLCIILLLIYFTNAQYNEAKRNLDPNTGCVRPTTREELQYSINVLLTTRDPTADEVELVLCKDTDVVFEKGDPRIVIAFPESGLGFSMRCKITRTCRIAGGYNKGTGRNFLGKAGFLEISASSNRGRALLFHGIKFSNFGVTQDGGVFFFFNSGNLMVHLIQCVFHNNHAGISGGVAILDSTGGEIELRVKHCVFKENEADRYGGVFAFRTPVGLTHTIIEHSEFVRNEAKADGGVMAYGTTFSNHQLEIKYSEFRENKAHRDGGCIFLMRLNPAEMKDCTFRNNEAGSGGSAYFAVNSQIFIDNVDVEKDTVQSYISNRWRRF